MEEAKLAKEKKMREMILPVEISKALTDFRAGEMATKVEEAMNEGVERFKVDELPSLL